MPVAPALSQDNIQNNNMQISAHGAWERKTHESILLYWSHANRDCSIIDKIKHK